MNNIYLQSIKLNVGHYRVLCSTGHLHANVRAFELHFDTKVMVLENQAVSSEVELAKNLDIKAELLVAKHIIKTELGDAIGGEQIRLIVSNAEEVVRLQVENSELVDCIPYAHFMTTRQIGATVIQREDDLRPLWSDFTKMIKIGNEAKYETVVTVAGEIVMSRHAIVRVTDRLGLKTLADGAKRVYKALQNQNLKSVEMTPAYIGESERKHGYVPLALGMVNTRDVDGRAQPVKMIFLIDNKNRPPKLITAIAENISNNHSFRLGQAYDPIA